jgi:hypothetical protein
MLEVFVGKVRKTGFFQKAGFPGNSDKNLGIYSSKHQDSDHHLGLRQRAGENQRFEAHFSTPPPDGLHE